MNFKKFLTEAKDVKFKKGDLVYIPQEVASRGRLTSAEGLYDKKTPGVVIGTESGTISSPVFLMVRKQDGKTVSLPIDDFKSVNEDLDDESQSGEVNEDNKYVKKQLESALKDAKREFEKDPEYNGEWVKVKFGSSQTVNLSFDLCEKLLKLL